MKYLLPQRLALTLLYLHLGASSAFADEPIAKAGRKNVIQAENDKPGSLDWQLTRVRLDKSGFRAPAIEGYCSKQSVAAGDTIQIMVSTTPAARCKIEIFRTGYYGGRGARLMTALGPFDGKPQPVPPVGERSLRECKWAASASLKIPSDWVSGVYLGRLTTLPDKEDEPYWQSYVVFIVRDDRPADVLFQCSDNTWQAYNRWPDNFSVYTNPKGNEGPWSDVSFDRPYAKYAQIYDNPQSIGSGEWLCFEFPLAYWLEKQGYNVAYCSNSDMLTPERGLKCKAFLSVGHDEYWDIRAYRSVVKMRDAGVNLLFLSGNAVCWVTPLKPSSDGRPNRIMFRGGPYGGKHKWAEGREKVNGPFPHRGPDEGYLIGARNVEPVNGGGDWIVAKPDHWMFAGTGMKKGDRIPGLVGWEYHGDPPTDLPGLEIVAAGTAFQGGTRPQQWTATIYPGPKDNFVFNASTIFWSQAMSAPPGHMLPWSHWSRPHGPDERVQKITDNLLRRALGKQPAAKDKAGWKALFDGKSLTGWKEANFGGEGEVRIEKGAILLEQGNDMTGVTYAGTDFPRMNYEVALEGKKIKGRDFFCTTTFPVGKEYCSLVVGGWGGSVVGISSINGADASENQTRNLQKFEVDRWYRVRIRVTESKVQAWIDDKQVVDLETQGKRLSIRAECGLCRPFGIATWRTLGAVRDIRLRTLTDAEIKAAR